MDSNIDKVREALEIADAFCGRHTADECPDTIAIPIKDALAALSAIDTEAIRRAQRMKSLLQSISSWFACWGIATKDDLGQSVEEFDREITDILSAEPAQDKRPLNEDEVCLNVGCEYHDKKYEQNCSGATNGSASPAAELCTMWRPKPAQDDGKPEVGNDIEVVAQVIRYHISAGGEYEYRGKIAMESFERIKRRLEEAKE